MNVDPFYRINRAITINPNSITEWEIDKLNKFEQLLSMFEYMNPDEFTGDAVPIPDDVSILNHHS